LVLHFYDQRRGCADRPADGGDRIDRKNGLGGYWATQILPFGDSTSFVGYMDFETATYANYQIHAAA
jgi:hypothetical protein